MKKIGKSIKIALFKGLVNVCNTYGMKKNFPGRQPERVLIISTTGLGDTLWGTPAIGSLKEAYPTCRLDVLTNAPGLELLDKNPNIDSLYIFKRGLWDILSWPALLKSLRKKNFEMVFIFHASDRIIWPLAFLTGAGQIVGINGDSKDLDFILTNAISKTQDMHGIERRLALLQQIGVQPLRKSMEIFLTKDEIGWADRFLLDKKLAGNGPIVGIHPGAQKPYKCWPSNNFVQLGRHLVEKFHARIIVTGNEDEAPLADRVSGQIPGAVSVAGKLGIRKTAAIIEKMNLFITNDTGPMHIAFALKTPTVALFSPTDPRLCGPYEALGKYKVVSKLKLCDPCLDKRCETPKCMEQITVEEVLGEAERLLKGEP